MNCTSSSSSMFGLCRSLLLHLLKRSGSIRFPSIYRRLDNNSWVRNSTEIWLQRQYKSLIIHGVSLVTDCSEFKDCL